MTRFLARWRVTLGFVSGAGVLWLARPTWRSLFFGAAIAAIGESVRLWAAGHVDKSREVTRSGPYRFSRHPLYVGSSIIGAGLAVASADWRVAALIGLYLGVTLAAAIRAEEAHLREKFGDAYDAYAEGRAPTMPRRFSFARARQNREHHTVVGIVVALALLAFKLQLSLR